jgi:predicted outer membrane protein
MGRLWTGAILIASLAGCRAENRSDQAIGAERPGLPEERILQSREPWVGVPQSATLDVFLIDTEQNATARLLASIYAISEGEVEAAKLALQKAGSPEVSTYARKLVAEHEQDMQAIEQLARSKHIDFKAALTADAQVRAQQGAHEEQMRNLRNLSGASFDIVFMRDQPLGHVLLGEIAGQGKEVARDAEVDAFFATIEGQAKEHGDEAQKAMPVSCGGSAAKPTAGGALRRGPHG